MTEQNVRDFAYLVGVIDALYSTLPDTPMSDAVRTECREILQRLKESINNTETRVEIRPCTIDEEAFNRP